MIASTTETIKLLLCCMIFLLINFVESYSLFTGCLGFNHRRQNYRTWSTSYSSLQMSTLSLNDLNDEKEKAWDQIDFDLINATITEWSKPMPIEYTTMPLVIAGPSGVGKNRLIRALLKDYSKFFKRVTTHTTRKPRVDEIHGHDYYFISQEEFVNLNTSDPDFFLETAYVHDNIYGASREEFYNITHKEKKIAILEIDVQGVQTIKSLAPSLGLQPRYLFIAPENIERLRERLHLRCTEKNEEINLRLTNAVSEMKVSSTEGLFDDILVNANFSEATNALFRIVRKWYPAMPNAGRIRALQRKMRKLKEDHRRQEEL